MECLLGWMAFLRRNRAADFVIIGRHVSCVCAIANKSIASKTEVVVRRRGGFAGPNREVA